MDKTIIEQERNLEKLLKQKRNYTYKYLRINFKLKTDYDVMEFLSNYFIRKLDNYNFESDIKENKYLSKVVKYFNYSLGYIDLECKHDLEETLEILNHAKNKIKKVTIEKIDHSSSPKAIENSIFLLTLREEIEKAISKIVQKMNSSSKMKVLNDHKLCDIVKDIIFNIKNTTILENLLDSFPNITLIKDIDDKFLLEKILDKHFNNLVNKNDYYEKIYYDKVIDLYMKCSYLSKDNIVEELFYMKMQKFINTVISKNVEEEKKNYILADINERIQQFELGQEIDFLKDRSTDQYYHHIDFDTIGDLVGNNKKTLKKDMTNRYVITIDNNEAKVLENAISVEIADNKYLLSIYAVDVSDFIKENRLFEKKRYENILDNKINNTLFNKKYRYDHLNLIKDRTVPVIAYDFIVDEDLTVSSFHFQRAFIKVSDNLKFSDFNHLESLENKKTKDMVTTLFELVFPYLLDNSKITEESIDNMLRIINSHMAKEIAKYTEQKNLPILYKRHNRKSISNKINALEKQYNIDLKFLNQYEDSFLSTICTIGNDEIGEMNDFSLSIFSPTRKVDALINQMLINSYLVDHEKLNEYTKNYLETRLDKIATNINKNKKGSCIEKPNMELALVKQYIKKQI